MKASGSTSRAQPDSSSDSDSQSESETTTAKMKPETRPNATKITKTPNPKGSAAPSVKSSTSKTPRKVDPRDVPGPSPKKATRNSDDESSERSVPVPKKAPLSVRSGHTRTTSLSRVKAAASSSSLKVNEAGLAAKPASKAVSVAQSAEDEDEESASVADSLADSVVGAAGGRISRTAKDRQEYFKNQSDCHAFGPHRAICSRCKKIVNLTRKQTYAVGPWERHRAKCDQELASDLPLPHNAEEIVNASAQEIFPEQPVRRNATERRAFLLDDNFVEIAEEDRVKCANCQKWVALKKGHPYDLAKWKQHRDKCASQSDRVLTAERKLAIVNDPLVKSFDSTSVECATCGAKVVSTTGKEYDLGAWEEHKAKCSSKIETPTSDVNSIPFPTESPSAKPPSTASTEVTLVATESAANQGRADQHSKKRPRDEDAGASEEDERPSNRARTAAYKPQDSPGVMGWIMLPFRSFARGFRESLKSSDRS